MPASTWMKSSRSRSRIEPSFQTVSYRHILRRSATNYLCPDNSQRAVHSLTASLLCVVGESSVVDEWPLSQLRPTIADPPASASGSSGDGRAMDQVNEDLHHVESSSNDREDEDEDDGREESRWTWMTRRSPGRGEKRRVVRSVSTVCSQIQHLFMNLIQFQEKPDKGLRKEASDPFHRNGAC